MPDVITAVDHGIMHEIYHGGIAKKYHVILEIGQKYAMMYENLFNGWYR